MVPCWKPSGHRSWNLIFQYTHIRETLQHYRQLRLHTTHRQNSKTGHRKNITQTQSVPLCSNYKPESVLAKMSTDEIKGGGWQNSLMNCSPCGSCILGSILPCLRKSSIFQLSANTHGCVWRLNVMTVVGRTSSRLRDPSNPSPEYLNGDCAIHGVLTLLASGWLYSMIKRTEVRERFEIPGSGCGDCCAAFWCQCCQVIQADKEVESRLVSGPVHQGYQPQTEEMKVPPPY